MSARKSSGAGRARCFGILCAKRYAKTRPRSLGNNQLELVPLFRADIESCVLPIPPFELVGFLASLRVVHGTAEYVEETAVLYASDPLVVLFIQLLRVLTFETTRPVYTNQAQIFRDRLPYSGNAFKASSIRFLHYYEVYKSSRS